MHNLPLPERPTRDEALDRGYDSHAPTHDHITPEPVSEEWQAALDGAIEQARQLRQGPSFLAINCEDPEWDPMCGERCDDCGERMCATYGPEPRACGVTCCDCPCDCQTCVHVREDMRADLLHQIAKEDDR